MPRGRSDAGDGQAVLEFDGEPELLPHEPPAPAPPSRRAPEPAPSAAVAAPRDGTLLDASLIERSFGRALLDLLDLDQWQTNPDPAELFRSIGDQARRAVERERAIHEPLRRILAEQLADQADAPPHVGLHEVSEADLERVARSVLYNGRAEAVVGDFVIHDSVPLSLAQAGVCLVSYSGRHNQWQQRLIRRELEINLDDPVAEAQAALEGRDRASHPGAPSRLRQLSDLARRGVVSYMERRVMLTECADRWRIGAGPPVPFDLMTGAGNMELLGMSLQLLRQLLLGDPRWLFVASGSGEPGLMTLCNTLREREFAVLTRLHGRLRDMVGQGHYPAHYRRLADAFVDEVGPQMVVGAYRAGPLCPARFFVAHAEHSYTAALIAMADSLAVQPTGFPALVQLGRASCRAALGGAEFEKVVQQAYRDAGAPEWFYRGEVR